MGFVDGPATLPETMLSSVATECTKLFFFSQHFAPDGGGCGGPGGPGGLGGPGCGDGDGDGARNLPETIEPSRTRDWIASLDLR